MMITIGYPKVYSNEKQNRSAGEKGKSSQLPMI